MACILAMIGTWAWLFYQGFVHPLTAGVEIEGDYLVGGLMPVAIVFAASALALVVVSLATSPPPAAHVERFMIPRSSLTR